MRAADAWCAGHHRLIIAIIIIASVALRATYFVELNRTPLIDLQRWDQVDMHYYDGWAREIVAGDYLSASLHVPTHNWHRDIADAYFAAHPEAKTDLDQIAARTGGGVDAAQIVWDRWLHAPQFYQDALYPYLIAITYRLVGFDARWVLAWQLLCGVLTNLMIWSLARRSFGEVTAALAAGMAVLSGSLMYYELLLLRESLIVFIGLAAIWFIARAFETDRYRVWWFGAAGVVMGLAVLLKSTLVLLPAGALAAVAIRLLRDRRALITSAAAIVAGCAIGVAPLMARNAALGISPFKLASAGPLTFVASNEPSFSPDAGFSANPGVLADFLGGTDGGWPAAFHIALGPQSIGDYAALLWRKWDRVWYWYEIPNNDNFYYMSIQAPVLAWLPVTFGVVAPLALVGLALAARRLRDCWLLIMLLVVSVAPLLIFYVLGRFRVPVLAVTIPFAALTLVSIARWIGARRYGRAAGAIAAVAGLALWTGRPLPANQSLIRTTDWVLPYMIEYRDVNDPVSAAQAYFDYFRYEPTPEQIVEGEPDLAQTLAQMHENCAHFLEAAGQPDRAREQSAKAESLLRLQRVR